MTWGSLNPHPPTSDFQVGDRVVVTGKPFGRASLAIPDVGMTGEVVRISLKAGRLLSQWICHLRALCKLVFARPISI